jgi:hypothetical protein
MSQLPDVLAAFVPRRLVTLAASGDLLESGGSLGTNLDGGYRVVKTH